MKPSGQCPWITVAACEILNLKKIILGGLSLVLINVNGKVCLMTRHNDEIRLVVILNPALFVICCFFEEKTMFFVFKW